MMTNGTALAAEFPFVSALPKREKGRIAKLFDALEAFELAQREHGPLMPQVLVADMLGVSRARVGQWVEEGRLRSVEVRGSRLVSIESFREFAKQERKTGRPTKATTMKNALQRGMMIGESINEMV